jgi:hypothetical protein
MIQEHAGTVARFVGALIDSVGTKNAHNLQFFSSSLAVEEELFLIPH